MAKSAIKSQSVFKAEPILYSIFHKAEVEYRKVDEMFSMLGWGNLPAGLKFIIEEDVKGYVDELLGNYSSNSPFVQKRRESVDFWVSSFMDGVCTLDTAVDALKVKRL